MKGVLLVNLGSPQSPELKDVKAYLNEFLMDGNVIDVPYLIRLFLVRGIIVPNRAKNSARLYKKIWTKEGSPLIVNSERLAEKVKDKITMPLALAMRYGQPSAKNGLNKLYDAGVNDVLVVLLYPHFAMSSTRTAMEDVENNRKKYFPHMKVSFMPAFYYKKEYILALANSIRQVIDKVKPEHLLFSYHGLPERHLRKTDPTGSHCLKSDDCCSTPNKAHTTCYRHQCFETTELVVKELGLAKKMYSNSFQSRLGNDPWIQPFTPDKIHALAQAGIKNLAIVTPAFVSDCLETIEEIGMEAKEHFLKAGGETFTRIECLNTSDEWVNVLSNWIEDPAMFGAAY